GHGPGGRLGVPGAAGHHASGHDDDRGTHHHDDDRRAHDDHHDGGRGDHDHHDGGRRRNHHDDDRGNDHGQRRRFRHRIGGKSGHRDGSLSASSARAKTGAAENRWSPRFLHTGGPPQGSPRDGGPVTCTPSSES